MGSKQESRPRVVAYVLKFTLSKKIVSELFLIYD